jgi:hypothetical protein
MAFRERASVILSIFFPIILAVFFLYQGNFLEISNQAANNATSTEKIIAVENILAPTSSQNQIEPEKPTDKPTEQEILLRSEVLKKSGNVKGIYLNSYIASAYGSQAQQNIKKLLSDTELNAVVIDIKESEGIYMPSSMKKFISDLHQQNVWVVARICAFRDSSLVKEKPEWYLKFNSTSSTSTLELWRDSGKTYWLDPANPAAQDYLIDFAKKAVDFGFDELQFDYVRFPSDGEISKIIYPYYDSQKTKSEIMKEFFNKVSQSLKEYNYSTVFSVDLFGYVATQYQAGEIGQRVADAADNFDYISFMLYPSHFYAGFSVPQDAKRQLPAVYFSYSTSSSVTSTESLVSSNPYQVILRSIFIASDYLAKLGSKTKIRPWLQDFNINPDTNRGIYYDAQKVRAQIQAAQDASSSGWLLWNPSNVYTREALLSE